MGRKPKESEEEAKASGKWKGVEPEKPKGGRKVKEVEEEVNPKAICAPYRRCNGKTTLKWQESGSTAKTLEEFEEELKGLYENTKDLSEKDLEAHLQRVLRGGTLSPGFLARIAAELKPSEVTTPPKKGKGKGRGSGVQALNDVVVPRSEWIDPKQKKLQRKKVIEVEESPEEAPTKRRLKLTPEAKKGNKEKDEEEELEETLLDDTVEEGKSKLKAADEQKSKKKKKKREEDEDEVEREPKTKKTPQGDKGAKTKKGKRKEVEEEEDEDEVEREPKTKKTPQGDQGAKTKKGKRKEVEEKAPEEDEGEVEPKIKKGKRQEEEEEARESRRGPKQKHSQENQEKKKNGKGKSDEVEEEARKPKQKRQPEPRDDEETAKGKRERGQKVKAGKGEEGEWGMKELFGSDEEEEEVEAPKKKAKVQAQESGSCCPSALRRSDTSKTVHVDEKAGKGVVQITGLARRDESGRLRRVKVLTEEQKEALHNCTSASAIPVEERKCLYAAMDRKFQAGGLPSELVQKYYEAAGSHGKKFELLKEFLISDELRGVQMTAYVDSQQCSSNKEVFEEVMLLDLKARYNKTAAGRQYITDICASQKGRPHPKKEFRDNADYRIYKIFKKRSMESGNKNKAGTLVSGGGTFCNEASGSGSGSGGDKDRAKILSSALDQMRPLPEVPAKGKNKRKKGSDSEDDVPDRERNRSNNNNKEVTQDQQDKKTVEKYLKQIRSLAGKARTSNQDLSLYDGHEDMRAKVKAAHTYLTNLAAKSEEEMVNGATNSDMVKLLNKKMKKIQEYEDFIDGVRATIRTYKSREKKRAEKAEQEKSKKKQVVQQPEEDPCEEEEDPEEEEESEDEE